MANPSPAAITLIRSQVADWTADDATIAATLNAPTITNPAERPTIAKPFAARDLMGVLDGPAKGKLLALPGFGRLLDDIQAGEIETLENWVSGLLCESPILPEPAITPEQAGALMAILHAEEDDPNWPEQISWAESVLGRLVDASDIAEARPGDSE